MRTSRRLLAQVRRATFVAFMFSACINVLMLAMPLYALQIFENVVRTGSLETLFVLTALVGGAILTTAMIEMARDRIMLRSAVWIDHELGQHMLQNGLKQSVYPADLRSDSRSLMRLRAFLGSPAMMPLFDAPFVPLFILVLFALHPMIGLLAAASATAMLLAALALLFATNRLHDEADKSGTRSEQWWSKVAAKGDIVGALGLGPGATSQWEWFNRDQIDSSYALGKRSGSVRIFSRTLRVVAQTSVYGIGAWLVVLGEITPGALVASAIIISRVVGPLDQLVGSIKAIRTAWISYTRLKALPADAKAPSFGNVSLKPTGKVELANVFAQYPGRKVLALRGVSLSLAPGRCLALVGPNGSGKSTLAGVIAGAVKPSSGSADLDGLPIHKWQRWDGLPPVGYMPDEPELVEGSVYANIARFRDVSLMSIAAAAMKAGVHEVFQCLPEGYDTNVGPDGRNLSLSERRAVALVRALHGTPSFVVLDEPEAGLDGAGVKRLAASLASLKDNGVGLVIATQDPRFVTLADDIALLGQGSLVSLKPASEFLKSYEQSRGAVAPIAGGAH